MPLMSADPVWPYSPPSDVADADTVRAAQHGLRGSIISGISCVIAGFAFVISMAIADFDTETVILFAVTVTLLFLALAVFFLRLRVILPMFVLMPFLVVVAGRHVGDMGPVHYIDGGIYLMGSLVFFVALVLATAGKSIIVGFRTRPHAGG